MIFLRVNFIVDFEGLFNGFFEVFNEVLKLVSEVNKIVGKYFVYL